MCSVYGSMWSDSKLIIMIIIIQLYRPFSALKVNIWELLEQVVDKRDVISVVETLAEITSHWRDAGGAVAVHNASSQGRT